ncbi:UPF0688 protein C1orf174 homolog isoform X2 [Mixophyes fleayi]|uniref:UPF0688 protein C1orf174 homolog isoform X2 n=1 Tax=Mixophyes fleayi TaxID=3061075 RepID=UPI003F4E3AB7
MKRRKLTDGMRCSVRQKNKNCSAEQNSSDNEAEICNSLTSGRKGSLASPNKDTNKSLSKNIKYGQNSGLVSGGGSRPKRRTKAGALPKSQGRRCPKVRVNTRLTARQVSKVNDFASYNGLTDDSGDGMVISDLAYPDKRSVCADASPFLDEDSNQPMPLGRFFENADLMQKYSLI